MRTAEDFAAQTELLAATGHLTYLIDTSISHLSAFGTMVRKVRLGSNNRLKADYSRFTLP